MAIMLYRYFYVTLVFVQLFVHCKSQSSLVTAPDGKQILMEDLLYETSVESRLECAELCYNSTLCSGSMLRGSRCYLYRNKTCRCPIECPAGSVRYHQELCSCYTTGVVATSTQTLQELSDTCQQQGMHLLSVNSELEHEVIVDKVIEMCKIFSLVFWV